jgi:hypothetical protein
MNARERFQRLVRGQQVDRMFYLEEPIRKEVLERWYEEGLSRSVGVENYLDFFGLDRYVYLHLPLRPPRGRLRSAGDFGRLENHYLKRSETFQHPAFWQEEAKRRRHRDFPLGFMGWRGFLQPLFTRNQEWQSLQDVLLALYDFPNLVKSALDLVTACYVEIIELAAEYLDPDFGIISEPIASRSSPVISPSMIDQFLVPCYRKIVDCFHGLEIRPVIFRSWCNVTSLIPLILKAGIDAVWIGQGADLINYQRLRTEHPDLLLIGGLDADALAESPQAIREEVSNKLPNLLKRGRYLPTIDDNPRENVPYRNYQFYRSLLREVCEEAGL